MATLEFLVLAFKVQILVGLQKKVIRSANGLFCFGACLLCRGTGRLAQLDRTGNFFLVLVVQRTWVNDFVEVIIAVEPEVVIVIRVILVQKVEVIVFV